MISERIRKYISEYEDLMEEWDWDRNIGSDPYKISYGSNFKYWWICKDCGANKD